MLILLCYFAVFTTVLSVHIVVNVKNSQPITDGTLAYLLCQLNGENPNCDRLQTEFRQYLNPKLTAVTVLMIGFINWIYLIFPIHYKDLENIIRRITTRIHRSQKTHTETTVRSRSNSYY